jgi:CheY-like chemotaxis protein
MTLHILHVEDDPDIREIAMMSLELSGDFRVDQCSNGADCLQTLETCQPDVFLFDVMMPGMDGLELLAEVRKQDAFALTPVIFMTARVQASERQALLDAGAVGIISKPFDPIDLGQQISDLLAKK